MKKNLLISLLIFVNLFIKAQDLTPPADLQASHILDEPDVTLSWWEPGTEKWLHYDDGGFYQSIGFDAEAIFDAAIKYEPSQLMPFDGMKISQMAFVPAEANSTYTLRIWMGDEADSLIYEQIVSEPEIDNWNIVELDSTITLDGEKTWYFGYNADVPAGFPVGCDQGPAKAPGKCDLIRVGSDPFESVYQYGLDLNFCIQVFVEPADAKGMLLKALPVPNTNHANRLALSQQKKQAKVQFEQPKAAGSADAYHIYRNDAFIGSSETDSYEDVLEHGGIYNYYVTALYGDEESDPSNTVEVIYDNKRIYPNTIIAEALLNTNEMSPSSPGAYLGMYEMNYEFERFAPIIYHSATEILGEDPFSNPDSEERFMEYFMVTGAFPMAIFNGMALAGGGSDESLYEYYRGAYESILDVKTPLTFDLQIEKISSSKFQANIVSKVVGVYKDLDLKLHVVLTESNIDYSWANGAIDQVNFVARGMFPSQQGSMLEFVGDSIAEASVEFEIEPFANKENYKVVAFIQHPDYFTILNGDIKSLPQNKNVSFSINDTDNLPIYGAQVNVNDQSKTTDENGNVVFGILDNIGELSFEVVHEDYIAQTGVFHIDTTENIHIVLNTTSIIENVAAPVFVYPNPATDVLYIKSIQHSNFTLMDITGKTIRKIELNNTLTAIDVSDLTPGVYYLQNQSTTKRLIIQ